MAPNSSLRGRSPCDVFRIRDISEASICIYLDSISKELFKIGAIWINGCGTNCFLSVHIKNATFSKWITNTVITETGMLSQGPVPELRADLGTPCPEGLGTCSIGSGGPRGPALGWAGRPVWDSACPRRASERPAPSPPARVPGGCALPLGTQCPRAHIAVTVGSHGMQVAPAVPGDIMLSTHTLSFLPNVPELGGHARQCSSRGGERGTPPGGGRRTRGPCAARGPDPRRTLLPVTALGTRPRAGASGWAAAHVRAAGGVLGPPWGECLSWGRRQVCPRQSCVCSSHLLSCVPCLGGGVPGPLASRRDVAPTRPCPHQPPLWEKPPVGLFWGPGLHLCDPCTFPTANPAGAPGPRPPPITVTGAAGPSSP